MIKKEYYKACDLFIVSQVKKIKEEYLNEYGYNIFSNRKNGTQHFEEYCHTNQNNHKKSLKR